MEDFAIAAALARDDRIVMLERVIGWQALEIGFLRRGLQPARAQNYASAPSVAGPPVFRSAEDTADGSVAFDLLRPAGDRH